MVQANAQINEPLTCSELSSQIFVLSDQIHEIENNWVTWAIKNEDSNLMTVPLEIAKESLTIWNVCGGVPSMLLVYGAGYPINEAQSFLRSKGIDGGGTRAFFNAASTATLVAIYPFGVAFNFASYSAAFAYNQIMKKGINSKLEKLKLKYDELCT